MCLTIKRDIFEHTLSSSFSEICKQSSEKIERALQKINHTYEKYKNAILQQKSLIEIQEKKIRL